MFKRISIILLTLLTILAFTLGVGASLYVVKDADNTYIDYQDENGVSIFKIDDDDGVVLGPATFFDLGTMDIGVALTTGTHAFEVHSEPVLHTAYSSSFGIRSRYHIDTAQTNTVTFHAVDARLRVKKNLAGGVHSGVTGYIEASGTPAFAGGINAAGVFTLELGTGATITGDTYMCGVYIDSASHADLVVTSTTYVALMISAGDGPPVKEDWEYGIWMDDGDVGVGIQIGDCVSGIVLDGTITTGVTIADGATTGISITGASGYAIAISTTGRFRMGLGPDSGDVGIPVTTSQHAMEVYTSVDTLHTAYSSSFGIRSRYLIGIDQTNTTTFEAVDARLRVKYDLAGGVHCGVQGYIESSGTLAFAGGLNAAGSFTLELQSGTTITGSTYMCGVSIDSASNSALVVTSTTYVGLRIWAGDGPPVKEDWEVGIYMDSGDVGTGIEIVAPTAYGIVMSTADVPAISITNTNASGGNSDIKVSSTFSATGATAHRGIESDMTYDPASAGGSVPIAIAGKVTLNTNKTHETLYMWGIQGGLKFLTGSTVDSNQAAAGRFVLEEAGTVTYTGKVTGLYVDNLIPSPMGSESGQAISIARFANHGGNVNAMIELYANECDNLFDISGSLAASGGPCVETSGGGATRKYSIEIMVEGNTCYLSAYTD